MAEVTVVIPNYNGIGYLKDCLDTLREQTCKNYETVLVDNGSTDGSLAFVKEHYPWVKIAVMRHNLGFSGGVNVTGIMVFAMRSMRESGQQSLLMYFF